MNNHTVGFSAQLGYKILFFMSLALCSLFPHHTQAFYEINAQGGGCKFIGEWDADTRTCTLTQDITDYIVINSVSTTLDGNGHTIDLSGSNEHFAVKVQAGDVEVKHTTIIDGGIFYDQADEGRILYNTIKSSSVGVSLFDLQHVLVEGNEISALGDTPIDRAITVQNTFQLTLQNNHITRAGTAVELVLSEGCMVAQNIITDSQKGITMTAVTDSEITGNVLDGLSGTGLLLDIDDSVHNRVHGNSFSNTATGTIIRASIGTGPILTKAPVFENSWIGWLRQMVMFIVPATVLAQEPPVQRNELYGNNFINNVAHLDIPDWATISLSRPLPEGGNYWDTYDEVGEGCSDGNVDGVCDDALVFIQPTVVDQFPLLHAVSVAIPAATCADGVDNDGDGLIDYPDDPGCANADDMTEINPPLPTCTLGFESIIIETGEHTVLSWDTTNAGVVSIDNGIGPVAASGTVDVAPEHTTTYTATATGGGGATTCAAVVTVTPPASASLGERAAALAKLVVKAPYLGDGDTWGGKGWDYGSNKFVEPDQIFNGYRFWNNKIQKTDFGAGLDCSGLVMWSFNSANDPTVPYNRNTVSQEGADRQYRYNVETDSILQEELLPGDLLFFSYDGDPAHFKEHVAMYVGGGANENVVEAFSPRLGIIFSDIQDRANDTMFIRQFSRVKPAVEPAVSFNVSSPVDLVVTDPDGYTISQDVVIQTNSEYLREIPGELYYTDMVRGHDGQPTDQVYSYKLKDGIYQVKVVPDATATSGSTYSLTFTAGGTILQLATNELVSSIPAQGFSVEVANGGDSVTKVEVLPTPEQLFVSLTQQIVRADISRTLRQRLRLGVSLAEQAYKREQWKAATALLTNTQRSVKKKTNRDIAAADAAKIEDTINKLLLLISYEHTHKDERAHEHGRTQKHEAGNHDNHRRDHDDD